MFGRFVLATAFGFVLVAEMPVMAGEADVVGVEVRKESGALFCLHIQLLTHKFRSQ